MSLPPDLSTPSKGKNSIQILKMLSSAAGHASWKQSLQRWLFSKMKNVNMDKLTHADTLEFSFFKSHELFKDSIKRASKDADGKTADPFDNEEVVDECFNHSLNTGEGFMDWVYTTYTYICASLSSHIQDQTAGVKLGDIIALLAAIKLAVHEFEIFDPDDLESAFMSCTMAEEGGDDLMQFLAVMHRYMQRLEAVGVHVTEKRKIRVLNRGLHPLIFEYFVTAADNAPYPSFYAAEMAVKKLASKPMIAAKLRALKPGHAETFHSTLVSVKSPNTRRFESLEATIATMTAAIKAQPKAGSKQTRVKSVCFSFRDTGACRQGDKCRFDHAPGGSQHARKTAQGALTCIVHGAGGHSTATCNLLLKNPDLKAALIRSGASADLKRGASGDSNHGAQQIHSTTTDVEGGYSFIYMMRAQPVGPVSLGDYVAEQSASSSSLDDYGPISSYIQQPAASCSLEDYGPVGSYTMVQPCTSVAFPEFMFSTRANPAKTNLWCVDTAATAMATYDASICHDIRSCKVQIFGSNSAVEEGKMMCTQVGSVHIVTYDRATGTYARTLVTNVLIHESFPFHIFSAIVALDRGNKCAMAKDSMAFTNNGHFVMHASQRLLNDPAYNGRSDSKLYWIDQAPPVYLNDVAPTTSSQFTCRTCTFQQARTPAGSDEYFCIMCHQGMHMAPPLPFKRRWLDNGMESFSPLARVNDGQRGMRFACQHCTFDQAATGPNICIVCFQCSDADCNYRVPQQLAGIDVALPVMKVPVWRLADVNSACLDESLADMQRGSMVSPVLAAPVWDDSSSSTMPFDGTASILTTRHAVVNANIVPFFNIIDLEDLHYPMVDTAAGASSEFDIYEVIPEHASVFATRHLSAARGGAKASYSVSESLHLVKPLSTAKNLALLLELHCAHAHWNFDDIASQYKLTMPNPRPTCWACMMAKPRRISHDKVSTRKTERVLQGIAADAKGPISTPTPEGFKYFFLVVCLFSCFFWAFLAKSQDEWKTIWPTFVKQAEASTGKPQTISFVITDGHTVHSAHAIQDFNNERGIQTFTTAPHSQWQDPAERGIQTIMNGARTSLIHGGGREWMWGWAVLHSVDSANRMLPPHVRPGFEGKSRLRVMHPEMTAEKEMRTHRPFLCLAFKTTPNAERASNFHPRAEPCVYLRYDPSKKAYALLTIPNLYLTYSVEVRFVSQAFPLRVTNHLSNQLSTFLRPSTEDNLYSSIHGPARMMRHHPITSGYGEDSAIRLAPVLVRTPVVPATLPGPGHSSTRGYRPTAAGLQSAAYGKPAPPSVAAVAVSDAVIAASLVQSARKLIVAAKPGETFTADQLVARTPRNGPHALASPDVVYWVPSMKKDFAIIRDNKCIINITDVRPHGPPPPPIEQRFKIKHRSDVNVALEDIAPGDFKARTVARGDRFKYGLHYDETAAPVVHTPALKCVVAWGVQKGLMLFQWDVGAAFYGNKMDRQGVIVQLPPGYDPYSTDLRPLHLPPLYGELAGALPGIPQGSLLHYQAIKPELEDLGFKALAADNCVFLHSSIEMATTLHVDDGVLACPSLKHAEQMLGSMGLGSKRKITWGPLKCTLGIDFIVSYSAERRVVFMSQRAFAVTILERANMLHCNAARLPAKAGRVYSKSDCPNTDEAKSDLATRGMTKDNYHSIQASINFYRAITRDDLAFINGKLAKFVANPGEEHHQAQKLELRFIKGTLDYGIEFVWNRSDVPNADGPLRIEAWSDSSYADDKDTGRTTLGYVIKVNGATVTSASKLSARVDSCVNHSELNAFTAATGSSCSVTDGANTALVRTMRTVAWLRGVKAGLERRTEASMPPTPVYVDNSGVLSMLKDTTLKSANKHIYRTLQEARERVSLDKAVVAIKVHTKHNIANAMTKQEPGIDESAAQLRLITGPCSINVTSSQSGGRVGQY